MLIATIKNRETGETRQITRNTGATAPICLQFCNNVLGYWETRLEVFEWATEKAGFDFFETDYYDMSTG